MKGLRITSFTCGVFVVLPAALLGLALAIAPVAAACLPTGRTCGANSAASDRLCCPGTVCGWGGVCQPGCRILGQFYRDGASNPANSCQVCRPRSSTTAWTALANGSACSDSNACTTGDACAAGRCVGGAPRVCADANFCTDDLCEPATGCVFPPNSLPCNDGNACTTTDTCQSGECLSIPEAGAAACLVKTVGTVPGVCASTDSIEVPAGTTVYYCYTVTNTGSVTLTEHTLTDDVLGTVFTGMSYSLPPRASLDTVTAGLTIPFAALTTTTNVATWSASDGGATANAVDSAIVKISRCPAGYDEVTLLSQDFSGAFPPPGWVLANATTGWFAPGVPDWTNTDPGARGNQTGGSGAFAIADSDACGSTSVMNAEIRTPVLDLTGLSDPEVSYRTDYNDISTVSDLAELEFSTDGGATWTNLLSWNEDHRGPLRIAQGFAGGGQSNVVIRWNYTNATWDWWWEIDDVVVTACQQSN